MDGKSMKLKLRGAGIPQWRLAKHLGISEATLQRRLRDLKPEHELEMLIAIDAILTEES